MTLLTLGLVQMAVEDGCFAANLDRVRRAIEIHGPSHDLLLFPETCLTGFSSREDVLAAAEPLDGPIVAELCTLAKRWNTSLCVGLAERTSAGIYNASVLIDPTGLVMSYRKTHLWIGDRGIFLPGDELRVCRWQDISVGLLICYDVEFPEPSRALAALGADLILVTNGNMEPHAPTHRRAFSVRAQENQVFVACTNRVGSGGNDVFVGESAVIAPSGAVVLRLDRTETVGTARIDTNEIASCRSLYRYLDDRRELASNLPALSPTGGGMIALGPIAR
jgi:(R)-amidase